MNVAQRLRPDGLHEAVSDTILDGMDASTTEAKGLPNEAFTDPTFLELENKTVFARSWMFAGPKSNVAEPGAVKCIEVAGRQLVMTTDRNGETRVFFNVCPHRGARLVIEDQDKAAALTCPYHGWAFGLDGSLRGRPHYHGPRDHDREGSKAERDCLFEVRSATWHDWRRLMLTRPQPGGTGTPPAGSEPGPCVSMWCHVKPSCVMAGLLSLAIAVCAMAMAMRICAS